jgi:hypothetical protein
LTATYVNHAITMLAFCMLTLTPEQRQRLRPDSR